MKANEQIGIDDIMVPISMSRPFSYVGKHSNTTLAGIQLNVSIQMPQLIQSLETIFTAGHALIADPFAQRSYQATIRLFSSSYQAGRPIHHYDAEIREVDMSPAVSAIEIEGQQYAVVKYREQDEDDDQVSWHVVLRLTAEQLDGVRALISRSEGSRRTSAVRVLRVGIDPHMQERVIWGGYFWSKYEDRDAVYYHQILRFVPGPVAQNSLDMGLPSRQTVDALTDMVIGMFGRFEVLVNELARQKVLADEQRQTLLGDDWVNVYDKTRQAKLEWQLMQVPDAESVL